ncbi:SBBP repeat-containing protein [Planctomycetota bacterium]
MGTRKRNIYTNCLSALILVIVISIQSHATDNHCGIRLSHSAGGSSSKKVEQALVRGASVPFIENLGQTDSQVEFYLNTHSGTVFVTKQGLTYSLIGSIVNAEKDNKDRMSNGLTIRETFIGCRALQPKGYCKSDGIVNYFVGTRKDWRRDVPVYHAVKFVMVWPSIDVELHARDGRVEKTFKIEPGGKVEDIRMNIEGVKGLSVAGAGDDIVNDDTKGRLLLATELGNVYMTRPIAYQDINGIHTLVEVSYQVDGSSYGFAVGKYDRSRTIIIDPLLASTFVGGGSDDGYNPDIAMDADGNVFITSRTYSSDFPTTPGTYDESSNGGYDVFVSKLDNSLTSLLASTFLGGDGNDASYAIAVDQSGNVFVAGYTSESDDPTVASDLPTTPDAYDRSYNGGQWDTFLSKLDNSLSSLLASTLLGGSDFEYGLDIAIASDGNVFVVGYTGSSDFPATSQAYDGSYNGGQMDAFLSKLDSSLSSLLASTFLGGSGSGGPSNNNEVCAGIAIDAEGNVFITGWTWSSDFPTTPGAYDELHGGSHEIFISRLDSDLTSLVASTFLGDGEGRAIALDSHGTVFVTGRTYNSPWGPDFPTTPGAYAESIGGGALDAFVSKLDGSLGSLLASTFLGGNNNDGARAIAIGLDGSLFVTGWTGYNDPAFSDYPTTAGAFDTSFNGEADAVVSKLNNSLSSLLASTFLGGSDIENGENLAIDSDGNVFVTGWTFSSDFPTTPGAYDESSNGGTDVFVSKLDADLSSEGGGVGKIAFQSDRDGNCEVYIMNEDGTDQTNLTRRRGFDSGPSWSPDGTKIAFHTDRDGLLEIYTMNSDGSSQMRLTFNDVDDASPSWSPDGSRIAFHSGEDGKRDIYVMKVNGTGRTRLTNNEADDSYPCWSPDGLIIAFHSDRDGNYEVYMMKAADGASQTNLTNNPAVDQLPAWSPDGTKIAFHSDRDSNLEVYTMNAINGTGLVRLTSNPAVDSYPSWSPDGEKLAFHSDRDGDYEIYVMNAADGTGQMKLTDNPAYDINPDWGIMSAGRGITNCIDFEDLPSWTWYHIGDTFYTSGAKLTVDTFFLLEGFPHKDGNVQVSDSTDAGGSGNELWVRKSNVRFDLGGPVPGLSMLFGEFGENLNISINGDFVNFDNFNDINGQVIGGVTVTVVNGFGNDNGSITLEGTINSFAMGGVELAIDDVCPF